LFASSLFIRPKIRGAVHQYQTRLIEGVKEDIARLHEKFKGQYSQSNASIVSVYKDIPTLSGLIIWSRQINNQLMVYIKRVEDILGEGWDMYTEGQKLKNECLAFQSKLDTRRLFENWLAQTTTSNLSVSGRIFEISKNRSKGLSSLLCLI
jgi:dynein heavy chain 1